MKSLRVALIVLFVVVIAASGCSKKTPQQVTDLNAALGDAKDACATVYAADELAPVQTDVDQINGLVTDKKMGKAKKDAVAAMPAVAQLEQTAASARAETKAEAEGVFAKAAGTVGEAAELGAEELAPQAFGAAAAKLAEAEMMMGDPCKYPDARRAAAEADELGREAGVLAVAEAERLAAEEARLLAEAEARRLAEEEARRIAEREAWLAAQPPEYEVQRGDYLWKISGMERIYRASRFWPIIFDANRGQIDDPDLIYPGQVLNIPREIDEAEMNDTLRMMWGKASRGEEL